MSMNIISIISHIKWYQIFDFNMKTHPLNPMVGTRLRGGPGGALGALYEKEWGCAQVQWQVEDHGLRKGLVMMQMMTGRWKTVELIICFWRTEGARNL